MASANIIEELEDYSSGDEANTRPILRRFPPHPIRSPDDPDFNIYMNKKAEKREKEMQFWYSYIRAYVPLMKLMLEDYKVKWESCQFRKYAKIHNPDAEDTDYDSDTSNGSVTSCIDMGFPNGDVKPTVEIGLSKGNIRNGLYMFLSYARGGWFYPEVKQFFKKELGVRCFRSSVVNDALTGPDDFRAMMKFKSDKARAEVFGVLCEKRMIRNFNFVCIDADESYFQDSVIENLKNTKGFNGLPRCLLTFKDRSLM